MAGSRWKTKEEVEAMFFETLKPAMYDELMAALNRLIEQPFSYKHREFIFQFRDVSEAVTSEIDVAEPRVDEDGKTFVEFFGMLIILP